jgi:hypothetical protein
LFLRKNKDTILSDLLTSISDGKISKKELNGILFKVGLGVVNEGLPGRLFQAYQMTDPTLLTGLGGKTLTEVLEEINKVHILLGEICKEVG